MLLLLLLLLLIPEPSPDILSPCLAGVVVENAPVAGEGIELCIPVAIPKPKPFALVLPQPCPTLGCSCRVEGIAPAAPPPHACTDVAGRLPQPLPLLLTSLSEVLVAQAEPVAAVSAGPLVALEATGCVADVDERPDAGALVPPPHACTDATGRLPQPPPQLLTSLSEVLVARTGPVAAVSAGSP